MISIKEAKELFTAYKSGSTLLLLRIFLKEVSSNFPLAKLATDSFNTLFSSGAALLGLLAKKNAFQFN